MESAVVRLEIGKHSEQVPSDILRSSSQYFDALFRFSGNNSFGLTVIALKEPLCRAFRFVIGNLLSNSATAAIAATNDHQRLSAPDRGGLNGTHHLSADFLFDCILICSKYLLDDLERHYTQLLVQSVRQSAVNYSCTDVINPQAATVHHNRRHQYHRTEYLSLLQIHQHANVFHLAYLKAAIYELIAEKRAQKLGRMRKIYFGF